MTSGEALRTKIAEKETEYKRKERNSMQSLATCEQCGRKGGVQKRYKLNPQNWHPIYARLCNNCGVNGKWSTTFLYGSR